MAGCKSTYNTYQQISDILVSFKDRIDDEKSVVVWDGMPIPATGERIDDETTSESMKLDADQQQAVSHTRGPLMVIAGPGSGKTHVLVNKVAKLVSDGVKQESILCMTFTKKAAEEMHNRLQKMGAGDVRAGTMHALCLDILKEYGIDTGVTEMTKILSELARIQWCVDSIKDMNIDSKVISLSNLPAQCQKMLDAIRLAKREMISADQLERYAKAHPDDGRIWAELVKVYRAYDAYKKEHNLIDYEDMVTMTVSYLQSHDAVLKKCQERYRYVLVDEFQDNNYAQFQLTKLLAGSRNVTVVGDRNQSIMGFQGAFDGIFEEFQDSYPEHSLVRLTRNYRCGKSIAEISGQLLGTDSKTAENHATKDNKGEIVFVTANSDSAEREFVAKTIKERFNPQDHDIAVLCTTNESCRKFAKTIRSHGLQATAAGSSRLTRNAAVSDVINLLKIADSPDTSGMEIFAVLKARGIYEHNIQSINAEAYQYRKVSNHKEVDGVYKVLLEQTNSEQAIEIQEIVSRLEEMIHEAKTENLQVMLHRIMTDYSDAYRVNANDQSQEAAINRAHLDILYDMAEEYQRYFGTRISGFIRYIQMADYLDLTTEIDPSYMDINNSEKQHSVSVLTIHKSKGKEFDVVFVTGLYQDNIPGRQRSNKFEIPKALLKGKGRETDAKKAHLQERKNQLYVAVTRTKEHLYLTYPTQARTSKKFRKVSTFLSDIKYDSNPLIRTESYISSTESKLAPSDMRAAKRQRIQEAACKAIRESRLNTARLYIDALESMRFEDAIHTSLINKTNLRLSATDIQTYLRCPLQLKYGKVLGVPAKPTIALIKGGVIHSALDQLGKAKMAGFDPDIEAVLRAAHRDLQSSKSLFGDVVFEDAESSLNGIIENYVKWDQDTAGELMGTEIRIETVIDGIVYNTKIDRIMKNPGGGYEIIDYKTGKSMETKANVKVMPQTNIYAKAVLDKYGSLPDRVSLVYLAVDKKNNLRIYDVTNESLETGLDIVRDCARRITSEEFDATPGDVCRNCSYRTICPEVMSD